MYVCVPITILLNTFLNGGDRKMFFLCLCVTSTIVS